MSPSYDSSRRRGVWSHWVPLIVTVTVATAGAAAWAWSQRKTDDEQDEADMVASYPDLDLEYEDADYGDNPAYGACPNTPPSYGATHARSADAHQEAGGSSPWSALRRSPSPQQFLDTARRTVAAAGAAVGSALAAITEEDKTAYADHQTWSEEVEAKKDRPVVTPTQPEPKSRPEPQLEDKPQPKPIPKFSSTSQPQPQVQSQSQPQTQPQPVSKDTNKRRKKVAIVISADNHLDDVDSDGFHEHASILSHIPRQTDFSKVKLYVLIYAPNLKDSARETTNNLPPPSLSSSFSNIDYAQAQTPGDDSKSPLVSPSTVDTAYNAIYAQAQTLVEKDSLILTFTTPNGHSHILRHIQPEIVYLQESLAGENGSVVTSLQTWLRHDIILVVGAESGHGGLADSDSETEKSGKNDELWWHREDRVGRGRGVVVVDGMRVQDDWARRILGKE